MKTMSFVVPCYNSASYMQTCIDSLLACGNDIEIIVVNDGSTKDNTSEIAHTLEKRYPDIIRAIDQENKGHGGAVNTGIAAAQALYVKVVDSDDWLDAESMKPLMDYARQQLERSHPTDLIIANYIYDKVHEGKHQTIDYANVFPVDREFTWSGIGRFNPSQYLLMHSVYYRTKLIQESGLKLPEHCFYVDNIFVYVPLPLVQTIRYFNTDAYHYYIGREDQSVNEKTMLSRINQQLRITKFMIDAVDLESVPEKKLSSYMYNYLSMMLCICSVFLRMDETPDNEVKRSDIWNYLKEKKPHMYAKVRGNILNFFTNFPSPAGRSLALGGYRVAQKIFKFN
ncbi:MAG: glycosyltransferase family 2 protein [Eggerthellaceae bacterium]|nr:glycosyltransferase family 2 protein [Eggerthellaceae bacterium]